MGRNKKKTTYTERYYRITALLAIQLFVIAYPWDASALVAAKGDSMVFFEIPDTALEITPLTKLPSAKESLSDTKSVKPTEDDQEKVGKGEAVYSVSSTGEGTRTTGIVGDSGIKLAQTAEEGAGGAAQGVSAPSDKPTLARMEPLRLRRDRARKRVIVSPWLRALMVNFAWGGQVYDRYSRRFGEGIPPSPVNSVGIGIGASSGTFIWRPWLAVMGIGLGTNYSSSTSAGGTSVGHGESGNISLGVFPRSRFPFRAIYFRNRQVSETSINDTLSKSEGLILKQIYRTKRKTYINMDYSRTITSIDSTFTREDEGTLKNERENMNMSIARAMKRHSLNLRGGMNRSFNINSSEESKSTRVVGSDLYKPSEGLRISTLANYSESENFTPQSTGDTRETISKIAQVSSSTGFRVYEGKVGVNASARVSRQIREYRALISGASTQTRSSEGTMAAVIGFGYRIDRNWGTSGSASMSRRFETDEPDPRYDQRLSANYSADALEIGKYTYTYGGSAATSNSITKDSEVLTVSTGMGHGLSRPLYVGRISRSSLSLGQSYDATQFFRPDTGESGDPHQGLGHNVAITNTISGKKKRLSMGLSASDSRVGRLFEDFDGGNSQAANYRMDLNWSLSRTSSVIGSFHTQFSRTDNPGSDASDRMSNSGSLTFKEGLLFDVRGLTFWSTISISDEGLVPSFGDEEQGERFSWRNNLEYHTGRFRLLVVAAWEETDGDGIGIFRVVASRAFGSRR